MTVCQYIEEVNNMKDTMVIVMTVDDVLITESTRWFPFGLTEKDIIIFIGIIFFFIFFLIPDVNFIH